ncbi:hypothetical protein NHX12_022073 [Muraenolepis orangiensis]|uniref:C2H2 AKAP95-type domain-containing protein n=1 Tax=Muraenolepis orangiensis TaxID=630683 RepID=A0A9Q0EMH2_9TELE|nr:hypothetical protein NHX12_022073 [Muraenolepis orangiensis]
MAIHLQSRFHKDHLKFLTSQLSKPTTDFLQEYLQDKYEKTKQRISQFENHSATLCQVYREHDLTREISMDHFIRKVDAAHCAACDMFIAMQPQLIQKHMKSAQHNRKGTLEQSKMGCLSVARSILNHKIIAKNGISTLLVAVDLDSWQMTFNLYKYSMTTSEFLMNVGGRSNECEKKPRQLETRDSLPFGEEPLPQDEQDEQGHVESQNPLFGAPG